MWGFVEIMEISRLKTGDFCGTKFEEWCAIMQRKGLREQPLPASAAWRGGGKEQHTRCVRDLQIIQVIFKTSLFLTV